MIVLGGSSILLFVNWVPKDNKDKGVIKIILVSTNFSLKLADVINRLIPCKNCDYCTHACEIQSNYREKSQDLIKTETRYLTKVRYKVSAKKAFSLKQLNHGIRRAGYSLKDGLSTQCPVITAQPRCIPSAPIYKERFSLKDGHNNLGRLFHLFQPTEESVDTALDKT
ncbi:hypothetical protein FF38_07726 [Lucilia cuprina]|uniref:4Fe-4S ferredoxin-type domain-containing protein n=1 Tax=Lucilia cuprina TaxID=7375 RepID=A0A0L0BN75_LUCCU|nr:hypothetical protein FF38_07726 [Lucilia cuprina]